MLLRIEIRLIDYRREGKPRSVKKVRLKTAEVDRT
jgi:hypothetical protein